MKIQLTIDIENVVCPLETNKQKKPISFTKNTKLKKLIFKSLYKRQESAKKGLQFRNGSVKSQYHRDFSRQQRKPRIHKSYALGKVNIHNENTNWQGGRVLPPLSPFAVACTCMCVRITQRTNILKILKMIINTGKREMEKLYVIGQYSKQMSDGQQTSK